MADLMVTWVNPRNNTSMPVKFSPKSEDPDALNPAHIQKHVASASNIHTKADLSQVQDAMIFRAEDKKHVGGILHMKSGMGRFFASTSTDEKTGVAQVLNNMGRNLSQVAFAGKKHVQAQPQPQVKQPLSLLA